MKQLLAHLRTIGTPTLYRRDTSLYFQGEVPRYATVTIDGVVKGYTISSEGDEMIVNLFGKGTMMPLSWANNQATTSLFNYHAVSDVRALRIKKDDLWEAIRSNPVYMEEYLVHMASTQASLLLRVTGLCQSRATEKICYTLYYLAYRYGLERPNGMYEIDLKLTQSMLGNLIGQTRESTAKNLRILKEKGVVQYTSSTYFVHLQQLESYLGEDSFRDLAKHD